MNRWTIIAILAVFVGIPALVSVLPKRPPPIEYNVNHYVESGAYKPPPPVDPRSNKPARWTEPLVGRACDYHEHGCSE